MVSVSLVRASKWSAHVFLAVKTTNEEAQRSKLELIQLLEDWVIFFFFLYSVYI